jgi:hypothetical protein
MWSDLRTARLLCNVDRVAVVADADWIGELDSFDEGGRRLDVRGFGTDRRADSLDWLQS